MLRRWVEACARNGWSNDRIHDAYNAAEEETLDTFAMRPPRPSLPAGARLPPAFRLDDRVFAAARRAVASEGKLHKNDRASVLQILRALHAKDSTKDVFSPLLHFQNQDVGRRWAQVRAAHPDGADA